MNIEKLFSIRAYDGKRELKIALTQFLETIKFQSSFQTRLSWDQEQIIKKLTSGTCIFIMLGREICGLVDYHVQPLPWNSISHPKNHNNETVFISDFIIHPRFRRIGLATMLLGIVKNYSRYLGKKTIRTAISPADPVLRQFFETMGFVPGGIPRRTDEHIYELRLCGRLRKDEGQSEQPIKESLRLS